MKFLTYVHASDECQRASRGRSPHFSPSLPPVPWELCKKNVGNHGVFICDNLEKCKMCVWVGWDVYYVMMGRPGCKPKPLLADGVGRFRVRNQLIFRCESFEDLCNRASLALIGVLGSFFGDLLRNVAINVASFHKWRLLRTENHSFKELRGEQVLKHHKYTLSIKYIHVFY